MLNDRLYPINHVSKISNSQILKFSNWFYWNGQLLDYRFNIIIIYIYYNNITLKNDVIIHFENLRIWEFEIFEILRYLYLSICFSIP